MTTSLGASRRSLRSPPPSPVSLPPAPSFAGRSVEITFDGHSGAVITVPLSVRDSGFSLHVATRAGANGLAVATFVAQFLPQAGKFFTIGERPSARRRSMRSL